MVRGTEPCWFISHHPPLAQPRKSYMAFIWVLGLAAGWACEGGRCHSDRQAQLGNCDALLMIRLSEWTNRGLFPFSFFLQKCLRLWRWNAIWISWYPWKHKISSALICLGLCLPRPGAVCGWLDEGWFWFCLCAPLVFFKTFMRGSLMIL